MKRTVKHLLALLIGVAIVGMTACSPDSTTVQTASTNGWHTTAAPVTTTEFTAESSSTATTFAPVSTSAPITTAVESVDATAPVTTTESTVNTTAPDMTAALPVTATAPETTTAKPVTTAAPITTTAKPVTTAAPATVEPQKTSVYVLNTKSMVFHTQSCGSGKNIKAENRGEFNGTWEELIAQGYSPCGNCDPAPNLTVTPTTTKPSTTTKSPTTTAKPQGEFDYVLNTKSMKFHTPDCGSGKTIKDENRAEFSGTRDELIADGYSPCGNCKP